MVPIIPGTCSFVYPDLYCNLDSLLPPLERCTDKGNASRAARENMGKPRLRVKPLTHYRLSGGELRRASLISSVSFRLRSISVNYAPSNEDMHVFQVKASSPFIGAPFLGGGFFAPFLTDQKRVVKKEVLKIGLGILATLESGILYSCYTFLEKNC